MYKQSSALSRSSGGLSIGCELGGEGHRVGFVSTLASLASQLMDGTYFVSKSELLQFINSTLGLNLQKIEQVPTKQSSETGRVSTHTH